MEQIAVIGLGYVGLPVAVAFGKKSQVIGFDIDQGRLADLRSGVDRTGEISSSDLKSTNILYTNSIEDLKRANFFIVTVPTPIDEAHRPDLSVVHAASHTVGQALKPGAIVVYESTVYPGATEEEFVPILERSSGLKAGNDFKVGYSPERINPGDREHTFTKIKKVVSGQDEQALERVAAAYESVVTAGVFRAGSIKVAEAAKVVENTQRDLNVALVNELALIFHKMNIDTSDVLDAAGTKWNFLKFRPGLVGGHCIGVDPYYLTHKAEQMGYIPQVIHSGRRINDGMGKYIAQNTVREMMLAGHHMRDAVVTVMGITFKENCPDIRNSRVVDIIRELESYGIKVQAYDPHADAKETLHEYGVRLCALSEMKPAHAIIFAVQHAEFTKMSLPQVREMMNEPLVLIDVKGMFPRIEAQSLGFRTWRL